MPLTSPQGGRRREGSPSTVLSGVDDSQYNVLRPVLAGAQEYSKHDCKPGPGVWPWNTSTVPPGSHLCCAQWLQSCLTPHPRGLYPARLLCPWDFPGKNTGWDYRFLLWRIFPTQGSNPRLLHSQAGSLQLHHLGSHQQLTKGQAAAGALTPRLTMLLDHVLGPVPGGSRGHDRARGLQRNAPSGQGCGVPEHFCCCHPSEERSQDR